MPTSDAHSSIDWALCTRDGARRAQLRAFRRLGLREKLEAVQQLCDLSRTLAARRREKGLRVLPLHEDDPATRSARAL
jgi:GrpB-like predicted nucleotidyltransferase (UPF0157 family)